MERNFVIKNQHTKSWDRGFQVEFGNISDVIRTPSWNFPCGTEDNDEKLNP